jgi:hypothetical protein
MKAQEEIYRHGMRKSEEIDLQTREKGPNK